MLNFEPFSIAALQKLLPYTKNNPSLCSDLSAGYLYMWHVGGDVQFCIHNETLVVRHLIGEQPAFSYPIGENVDTMIDELIEYTALHRLPLRFFAVDEEILDKIRTDSRLQPAMWAYERRWSDYIYSFEETMTFKGKKYNGQRNHINKFKKLYGEPLIRFLTADDRPAVLKMLDEYKTQHPESNALERLEFERTKKLLEVTDMLGLYLAGLFLEGKLAAFSIGEIMGDSLLIHVEKALLHYQGIYPTMYSGFVRLISDFLGHPLRYINREDDSGDPGLRTSKTQYHPICMANKYLVHVDSPASKMPQQFSFSSGRIVLTQIKESDKQSYLALNTDVENNRYWGYDYREDIGITGPVNEDTFFNSVMYDMHAGDSVNFAIRLSEDGKMIGEAILWNFTSDSTAELGCRIFPEYQGNGYGKAAFGAAAEFAGSFLDLKVIARCYCENKASYRMITANGFLPTHKDQDYYWFMRGAQTDFVRRALL